jgi:hypothetical protein
MPSYDIPVPETFWQPTVNVFLNLEGGHTLVRRTSGLVLSASIDGARVCGVGQPRAPVSLERSTSDGSSLGAWELVVDGDGRFAVELAAGAPRIEAGERWRGISGSERVDWTVPKLDWQVNWPAFAIDFLLDPGQIVMPEQPIGMDCWGRQVPTGDAVRVDFGPVAADSDGRARLRFDGARYLESDPIASGLGGSTFSPGGHRLAFAIHPLRVAAHLGTPRVEVRSASGAIVDVTSASSSAAGRAQADDTGLAVVPLRSGAGDEAELEPGTQLVVGANGERAEVTLPLLDFDFTRSTGVVGQTEPGAEVRVRFTASDGATYNVKTVADTAGIWRVAPMSSEDRGSFSMLALTSIRAEISMGNRHIAVRTATVGEPDRLWPVWLPFTLSKLLN